MAALLDSYQDPCPANAKCVFAAEIGQLAKLVAVTSHFPGYMSGLFGWETGLLDGRKLSALPLRANRGFADCQDHTQQSLQRL